MALRPCKSLSQEPYDLMLLDINMPTMSGMEVLRRMRHVAALCSFQGHHVLRHFFSRRTGPAAERRGRRLLDQAVQPGATAAQGPGGPQAQGGPGPLRPAQPPSAGRQCRAGTQPEQQGQRPEPDPQRPGADPGPARGPSRYDVRRPSASACSATAVAWPSKPRKLPNFAGQIDDNFIEMLECCAPLHDIGKVGLPDHILLKPGKLTPEERIVMQAHTIIGSDTLQGSRIRITA